MPILSIIANWLNSWWENPYVEWADGITVRLMTVGGIQVNLVQGNNISVKLTPINAITVVVDNQ